jgi:hypothetical protein
MEANNNNGRGDNQDGDGSSTASYKRKPQQFDMKIELITLGDT